MTSPSPSAITRQRGGGKRSVAIAPELLRADKGIHDKCGIFGIWNHPSASMVAFDASMRQQHRGDSGAGIVTTGLDPSRLDSKHGEGLVKSIFTYDDLIGLCGKGAIAHVRYPTQGPSIPANVQPLINHSPLERLVAVAHNGEFANYKAVKAELEKEGARFSTTTDTEIALHKLVKAKAETIEGRVESAFNGLQPSYSFVGLTKNELWGIRDPSGVRPLILGRLDRSYVLASETVAFDGIGASYIGEIEPGEAVFINDKGVRRFQMMAKTEKLPCIFEHIYFGNPVSVQFGGRFSNSEIRLEFGRQLYREHPAKADLVIAVLDSGKDCADGFSEESWGRHHIPVRSGMIRSHYAGRTFIAPTQLARADKVREKFYANRSMIEGKRLVVVDDSIVRSTTIRKIIELLRKNGAREVHVRISSPLYVHGCYLGIDTPKDDALIARQLGSVEKIAKHIDADSLGYLSIEGMLSNPYLPRDVSIESTLSSLQLPKDNGFCTYCFDGIERVRRV